MLGPQNVKWPVLDSQHNALLCWLSPYQYRDAWWHWMPINRELRRQQTANVVCSLCDSAIAELPPYTRDQQLLEILDEHADRHAARLDRKKVAAAEALYALRGGTQILRLSRLVDVSTWDLIGTEIWGWSRDALSLEVRL